ncbi:MAG: PEGA domain-containing protein [Deltaproteobacteria bacterium]|nr:PEGA domain-containing protein [Deltaproteobacteria bacterium]
MSRHTSLVGLIAGLSVLVGGRAALAQPSASDAMTATARELYEAASAAYAKQDYATCEAKGLAAWGVMRHPQVAAQLGACELELEKARAAAEHLTFFLGHAADTDAEARALAEKLLVRAKTKVAHVSVGSPVNGAELRVDGVDVGVLPNEVFLEPGRHTLLARKEGLADWRTDVDVGAGEERTLTATFNAAPTGGVDPIAAGLGFGLGGAGAIVSIVLGAVAAGKDGDIAALHDSLAGDPYACGSGTHDAACADLANVLAERDGLATAATWTGALSGALLLGTGVYVAVAASAGDPVTALFIPDFGVGHAGAMVRGSF